MKRLPYLFMLLMLLAACNQTPQGNNDSEKQQDERILSSAEQLQLRGPVKLVIETIDENINYEPFDIDWTQTYYYRYISEEQGFVPKELMGPDDVDTYVTASEDDEFLVDEDGEVILPEDDLAYDEDYQIGPEIGIFEERGTYAGDEGSLVQYWFDEKGDFTEIRYYGAEADSKMQRKEAFKYDDKHQQLAHFYYGEDGKLGSSYKSQYDSLGRETYYEYFSMDYNNGQVEKTAKTYNEDGNLLKSVTTVLGKQVGTMEYRYDEQGNCIYSHSEGRGYQYTSETEYNAQNKVVKETSYKSDGSIQNITSYLYNDKGNATESLMTSYLSKNEGEEVRHTIREFDKRGNCTKLTDYYYGELESIVDSRYDGNDNIVYYRSQYFSEDGTDTTVYESTFKYDKKGQNLETVTKSSDRGNVRIRTTCSYTDDGQLKEQRTYKTSVLEERFCGKGKAPERLVERVVYTFDSHGNWIKMEYFNTLQRDEDFNSKGETREDYEQVLTGSRTRKIEYY
ncbi:MAG: hypothetical protein IJ776_11370 [Paludibacteraceae bacterium]|nr:hypothetical protein [Paludibacteraceae bacterium]